MKRAVKEQTHDVPLLVVLSFYTSCLSAKAVAMTVEAKCRHMITNKLTNKIAGVLFVLLAIFTIVSTGWAATYYVSSSSGNDSNSGTSQDFPLKTISKVNTVMRGLPNGAHQILFKRGDTWTLNSGGEASQFTIGVSGTSASDRLVIGDYGSGALPKINGNGVKGNNLYIGSHSYITIQNLEIYNAGQASIGCDISDRIDDLKITGCSIHDNAPGSGYFPVSLGVEIGSGGSSTNIEISYNSIYNSVWNCLKLYGSSSGSIHHNAIYNCAHSGIDMLSYSTTTVDVYSNDIYDVVGGIYAPTLVNSSIYDNDIHDSKYSTVISPPSVDPVVGIKVGTHGEVNPYNVTIRNNRIWNIDVPNRDTGSTAAIWVDNNTDTNIWNNTIYACWNTFVGGTNTNLQVANNLCYANTQARSPLTAYGSDPKFVNPIATPPDFQLQGNSPAIDIGTDVGLPYSGRAPDLGAYEYNSEGLQPPTGLRIVD